MANPARPALSLVWHRCRLAGLVCAVLLTLVPRAAHAQDVPEKGIASTLTGYVGQLLDPPGAAFAPKRGQRLELSMLMGGESPVGTFPQESLNPEWGGVTVTTVLRYYAVDRLAVQCGVKGYLGIDSPAAGTEAATVLTPLCGARYDLLRENRFTLLGEVFSGPSFLVFGDLSQLFGPQTAIGAELGGAIAARYSIGPLTAELRVVVGGRAGGAGPADTPGAEDGPFSAAYGGGDLGLTWSF